MALHKVLFTAQGSILKAAVIMMATTIAFTTKVYSQTPASQNTVLKYMTDTTYVTGKSATNPIYHTAEDATIKALCDYVLFTHLYDSTNFGASGVTSVGLSMPAAFTVNSSPVTSMGTFSVTFTGGQTANQFLATPNGTSGALGLRTIAAADVPTLNQSTTGNAATVTTNANLTGDITSVGNASTYNNVVPAAKGGAGSINGLLKANGSGTTAQAVAGSDYLAPTGSGAGLTGITTSQISGNLVSSVSATSSAGTMTVSMANVLFLIAASSSA